MENKNLFWHRVKFIALVLVFIAPFIGGWLALYVFELKPDSINYGTLVQPVKKLDWPSMESTSGDRYDDGFGRKWTFLLLAGDDCSELCRSNLFYIRQIRTLLGRDTQRLQNVLMLRGEISETMRRYLLDYPNLVVINDDGDSLASQLSLPDMEPPGTSPRLYLVDPESNYMMVYPATIDHYRVLDDIKKLMKLSQIG